MKKIMPPAYFYSGIALIILGHFIFPAFKIIRYPYNLLGILLIVSGIIINACAWQSFVKNKTTQNPYKNPGKLIAKGIYRISRNPMYLGMLAILLGISVLLGSLTTFIIPLIFFIVISKKFISLEERNMEKKFGRRYTEYKNKTRRWI